MEALRPDAEADGGAGGDGRGGQGGDRPARPELDDIRVVGTRGREDAPTQGGRRLGSRRRERERGDGLREAGDLFLALRAAGEVRLVGALLRRLERVDRVRGCEVVDQVVFHDSSPDTVSINSPRLARAARIWVLIVPSGRPSRSASSDWVKPP